MSPTGESRRLQVTCWSQQVSMGRSYLGLVQANALPGERATAVGALQDAWLEPSRRRLASRVRGTPTRQPAGLQAIDTWSTTSAR
eukprot:1003418-Amphidinium_carterae.1